MDKLRQWFGTPQAAVKTLAWVLWVWLLVGVTVGVLYLLALCALALFT